jgi:translation initiation factor IF-3
MNSNNDIKSDRVLLIDESGEKRGIFLTRDAAKLALEANLDLVEVGSNGDIPVCRIMNLGKFLYQKKKSQKTAHQQKNKEIKISPNIDENDLKIKIDKIAQLIMGGDRVTVMTQFRGRMKAHKNIGLDKIKHIINSTADFSKIDGNIQMNDDSIIVSLLKSK